MLAELQKGDKEIQQNIHLSGIIRYREEELKEKEKTSDSSLRRHFRKAAARTRTTLDVGLRPMVVKSLRRP